MNRREYISYTKKEFKEKFGYNKFHFQKIAREFFKETIEAMQISRPGVQIDLHHIPCEYNEKHYELWNPKYLRVLYADEHQKQHGDKLSEEGRRKISEAHKGHKWSPEFREHFIKVRTGMKHKWTKGLSEETKMKMRNNIWITNGVKNLRISINVEIPEGFRRGRTL